MKPALRSGDFWSGLVLAALGTYIVVTAHAWDYITEEGPGAGFFPMWYGGIMLALSIALTLGTVLRPSKHAQVHWKDVSRAIVAWVAKSCGISRAERITARVALIDFALAKIPREPLILDGATVANLREAY